MSGPNTGAFSYNHSTPGTTLTTAPAVNTAAAGSSFLAFATGIVSTVPTVSDLQGNSYPQVNSAIQELNDGGYVFTYLATNGAGQAADTWTVTGTNVTWVAGVEIQGGQLSNLLDGPSVQLYSTTGTTRSVPINTSQPNDLIVAAAFSGSGHTYTPAAAFTTLFAFQSGNFWFTVAYAAASTVGTYDPAWSGIIGEGFIGITIALKSGNFLGPMPRNTYVLP